MVSVPRRIETDLQATFVWTSLIENSEDLIDR